MKYIYTLIFCLIAFPVIAGTIVSVEWDPNTEPDLMGYRIYIDNVQVKEIVCPPNDPSCCNWTSGQIGDGDHTIYGTAFDIYGNESTESNVLNFTGGGVDYMPPSPIENFKIEIGVTI